MKKLAVCVLAAFAGWVGFASAADIDMKALQAKLAAQEAALNDIEAKMSSNEGGAPEQMVSMRKNAKINIGGTVTTSYFFQNGSQSAKAAGANEYTKTVDIKSGSLELSDNELEFEIEVNENIDAYLMLNLYEASSRGDAYGVAEAYWVRWKNICDTGFGLKVGRDSLVFGDGDAAVGYLYNFTSAGGGDGISWWHGGWGNSWVGDGSYFAPHNEYDFDGVTQIAPYWESEDGKLMLEASFFAHMWNDTGAVRRGTPSDEALLEIDRNGVAAYRSRNYGLGSMSARATWTPIEDLRFSASVVNYHSNGVNGWDSTVDELSKNNTAVALSFTYRPCFFNKMNIWSQYVRGWNVNNYDGADSDAVNFGVSFDLTDKLTLFAQGDYLKYRYTNLADAKHKVSAWAAYAGAMYDIGNGLSLEAGWRHEKAKMSVDTAGAVDREKAKTDTIYASLLFSF